MRSLGSKSSPSRQALLENVSGKRYQPAMLVAKKSHSEENLRNPSCDEARGSTLSLKPRADVLTKRTCALDKLFRKIQCKVLLKRSCELRYKQQHNIVQFNRSA